MSNQVQFPVFNFNSSQVRVIVDPNQEPWFCGSDVCDVLGYENSRTTIQKHCKAGGVSKRYTPTTSGEQEMNFINEPNLYRLIIKSRKPEAEKFEAWVFEEVLPQIRKTGKYALQKTEQIAPLVELPSPYISPAEQQQIQSAVQHTHHRTGLSYQEIYQRIKAKFKVAKYDQLKPEQMRDALLFIASMQPDFLTQPKQTINVDWFNMMNFALLLKQYHRFTKDLPHIHAYLSAQPEHSAMAGLLKNHLTEMKNNDRLFTDSILSLSEISNHFLPQDQWKSLMRIFSEMIVE